MRAVDREEAEQADFLVSVRVADAQPLEQLQGALREYAEKVRARSTQEPCCDCTELVWVDSISPKRPPRICIPCASIRMQAGGTTQ